MAGKPKGPFFVVLALVVVTLVGYALFKAGVFGMLAPEGQGKKVVKIDPNELGQHVAAKADQAGNAEQIGKKVELPDTSAPLTTVKEYTFRASERLP